MIVVYYDQAIIEKVYDSDHTLACCGGGAGRSAYIFSSNISV